MFYLTVATCPKSLRISVRTQSSESSDLSDGPITMQEFMEVKNALNASEAKIQQLLKVNCHLSEELRHMQSKVRDPAYSMTPSILYPEQLTPFSGNLASWVLSRCAYLICVCWAARPGLLLSILDEDAGSVSSRSVSFYKSVSSAFECLPCIQSGALD